jgi:FixJ family two-component response regulator
MTGAAGIVHVVDDDESLRTALTRLLMASGYRVARYESAAQFLERSPGDVEADCVPACILLDIDMPGMSGLQLQERLGDAGNTLPIVFLTGRGDISMSVRAMKAGAEDFLEKPVNKDDLLRAVERALARCRTTNSQRGQQQTLRAQFDTLTAREREVFKLLILGKLNKQIAFDLGNTERTVKAHRHSIMEKMQVKSVAQLVMIATQLGLVDGGRPR